MDAAPAKFPAFVIVDLDFIKEFLVVIFFKGNLKEYDLDLIRNL